MTKIDVLVITALKEEYEAALQAGLNSTGDYGVTEWHENNDNSQTPYLYGEFVSDGDLYTVALAHATRMGGTSTSPIASSLVEQLKPFCLAMCGVCAGNPGSVSLGDVIIAEMAYQYDEGKRKEGSFEADHRHLLMPDTWVREAQNLKPNGLPSFGESTEKEAKYWLLERLYLGEDPKNHPARTRYFPPKTWEERIRSLEDLGLVRLNGITLSLTDEGKEQIQRVLFYEIESPDMLPFEIKVGPIASGNVVVKDGITWDSLRQLGVRSVTGLEMEAAAIANIAYRLGVAYWVVAKGVMDYADPNKDDRYKPFAARASAEVLFRFLANQLRSRAKARVKLESGENVFQTAGDLAYGHVTYVPRECDDKLRHLITERNLIAIFGNFQIGKSSLLNQIKDDLPPNARIFHFDIGGKRTDDHRLFIGNFFDWLSSELGVEIRTWDELERVAVREPIVILIDEFGGIGNNKDLAREFIPRLIRLAMANKKIVVSLPIEIDSMEAFVKTQGLYDPKLWKHWIPIVVEPFKPDEVLKILSLLPEELFSAIKANLDTVMSKSKGHPQRVQCLCRLLFDKFKDRYPLSELIELIKKDVSYDG